MLLLRSDTTGCVSVTRDVVVQFREADGIDFGRYPQINQLLAHLKTFCAEDAQNALNAYRPGGFDGDTLHRVADGLQDVKLLAQKVIWRVAVCVCVSVCVVCVCVCVCVCV